MAATLREAIRDQLIAGVPLLAGRVFEPGAPTDATTKPFAVLVNGPQAAADPWATQSPMFSILVYNAGEELADLEVLSKQVKAAFHEQKVLVGSDTVALLSEGETGQDAYDDGWKAWFRSLSLRAFPLGWLLSETYEPDPITALRDWATTLWGATVSTNPATWAPSSTVPGIYFRADPLSEFGPPLAWGAWLQGTIRIHVVAADWPTRRLWERTVLDALVLEREVVMRDGSRMTLAGAVLEPNADPFRVGQLRVLATFGVLRSDAFATGPFIQHAYVDGDAVFDVPP